MKIPPNGRWPTSSGRSASSRLRRCLFTEVDNSTLILFRMGFGLFLFFESAGSIATGWVRRVFIEPDFTFPITGFDWPQPLSGPWMYVWYAVMAAAGLMVACGAWFRAALALFTVLWTGTYLMQTTSYNNHYYLLILLCVLLLTTPADADRSVHAHRDPSRRSSTCPRWCLTIFVLQTAIVYLFAFVAKLDADWLAGRPLAIWLAQRTSYPIIGPFYALPWLPRALAYGGLLFDGLVVPLLVWSRTRLVAVGISLLFHLFNSITFQIGVFPYLALSLSIFFFPPESVRARFFPRRPPGAAGTIATRRRRQGPILALLGLYFAIQIVLPLRHWLYPGNVDWTEEGHRMAWRMMLRTKWGDVHYEVRDPQTGERWRVDPDDFLSPKQAARIAGQPNLVWQLAHLLERRYRAEGRADVEVYAFTRVSLNGRKPRPIVDSSVDLTAVEPSCFRASPWILPLADDD
jgi:vitamin K-dependent gamma-carboxylase